LDVLKNNGEIYSKTNSIVMKNNKVNFSCNPHKKAALRLYCFLLILFFANNAMSQENDSTITYPHKNIIRYNLSGALLFGIDKYIIMGYERVISPRSSISINIGKIAFPKLTSISTDSLELTKDNKNNGTNFSVDYRFYLGKLNKYSAPRGVYVGPYYSFNKFKRDNEWDFTKSSSDTYVNTNANLTIHTVGFEFGYQFIFWKRLSVDMVLAGPGFGFYNYKVKFDGNVDAESKQQLLDGLQQLLTQKFPGMNYVFSDKEINANGTLNTTSIGYRYLIHIGFAF
jgi:hypothetical protein